MQTAADCFRTLSSQVAAFYFCCILNLRCGRCHGWGLDTIIDRELVAWLKAMWIVADDLGPLGLSSVSPIRGCERIFERVPWVPHILSYPKYCCDWQNRCKYHLFFGLVEHVCTTPTPAIRWSLGSLFQIVSKFVTCGIFYRVIWKGGQSTILKQVF